MRASAALLAARDSARERRRSPAPARRRRPACRCAPRTNRGHRRRPIRAASGGGDGREAGRRALGEPEAREDRRRRDRDAGIDEHGEQSGGSRSGGPSLSPRPPIIRARGSRQTGTSAPVACARPRQAGIVGRQSRFHARARAAPPPHPTSRRQDPPRPASSCANEIRQAACPGARSRNSRAARRTRLSSLSPAASAVGPSTLKGKRVGGLRTTASRRSRRRRRRYRVRASRRRAAQDMQRQIDLGGRAPDPAVRRANDPSGFSRRPFWVPSAPRRGASSGRPELIFFRIAGRSSGSGPMSRA